jgi:predicted alpha-1,2-mannosidase
VPDDARALGNLAQSVQRRHGLHRAEVRVRALHPRIPGYDPSFNDPLSSQGFYEGTSAQYTWMVPFDPRGLFERLGGVQEAGRRLDGFFAQINAGQNSANANLGNEPISNAPWLYNWLGQPYKTQALVRRTLAELYPNDLVGFSGNDDLGQMSAWYVMSAIGLYPAIPGTDVLALGSPLFPRIKLSLERGDVLLRAHGASPDVRYVDSLKLDGRPYTRPWLRFSDIATGARLDYGMSGTPNPAWGSGPTDAPPSYSTDDETACQP